MELHTDDFPLLLNRDFYKDLIENFRLIEHECSQLESDLQDETGARISADDTERDHRIAQDTELQTQINDLNKRMKTAEDNISDLQTRMNTAEDNINQLKETVYGMPSALLNEASSVDDDENDKQSIQEINTERNGIIHAE